MKTAAELVQYIQNNLDACAEESEANRAAGNARAVDYAMGELNALVTLANFLGVRDAVSLPKAAAGEYFPSEVGRLLMEGRIKIRPLTSLRYGFPEPDARSGAVAK